MVGSPRFRWTAALGAASAGLLTAGLATLAAWVILRSLVGASPPDGLIADMLGASPGGVTVGLAAGLGVAVDWAIPGLGLRGQLTPIEALRDPSPLLLLGVVPVVAVVALALLSRGLARRLGVSPRWFFLLSGGSFGLAVTLAVLGGQGVTVTVQGVAGTASVSWALVPLHALGWVGVAGLIAFRRAGTRAPQHSGSFRLPGTRWLAAVCSAVLVVTVVGPAAPAVAQGPGSPGGDESDQPAVQPYGGGPAVPPVDYHRPGVAAALDALRAEAAAEFEARVDPWRGTVATASTRSAFDDAATWIRDHAGLFGVAEPMDQLREVDRRTDDRGGTHLYFEQHHQGVPVHGSRVSLHLNPGGNVVEYVTNHMEPDLRLDSPEPTVSREEAVQAASLALPDGRVVQRPTLHILPRNPVPHEPTLTVLAWRVWLVSPDGATSNSYFVTARDGARVVFIQPMRSHALNRQVWDAERLQNWPPDTVEEFLDLPVRLEGQDPIGIVDADQAYQYTGEAYEYFSEAHGLDGWDGEGARIRVVVRLADAENNAFFAPEILGGVLGFGEGMVTRDIVAHEFAHGVTQYSAGLWYLYQSGALNESFSDIFAEVVENQATGSNDWRLGVGSKIGTIRDMSNPEQHGDPSHYSDFDDDCSDWGGVHTNSGIPNHAFYLLSQEIGIVKAAQIAYTNLTFYLAPRSRFTHARDSAIQSAIRLYGKTAPEVAAVRDAWAEVGVDGVFEAPLQSCPCVADVSLQGDGVDGLDPDGPTENDVLGAILHIQSLVEQGGTPALDHYGRSYGLGNPRAVELAEQDAVLRRKTAHMLQTWYPFLNYVDTSWGNFFPVTQEMVDELLSLADAYAAADIAAGGGDLATLLERERNIVDLNEVVGMSANAALEYLDAQVVGAQPLTKLRASSSVEPAVADEIARNGEADVFVVLREQADLRDLGEKQNRVARLTDGYRTLAKVAERSQRGVRQELRDRGAEFEQFWIVNAVHVAAVDAELALTLSERPEVEGLREVGAITVPRLNPTEDPGGPDGVEWNVSRIGAEEVWGTHDTRGEGIVVANIDTGVDMGHPALASQYRGFTGDASPDHAYNWFDPRGVCGALADGPCDNQGHGTHTMGTMVGDDGAGTQIGVAPKATWIAAKGCETSVCSVLSLLQAGQWVAAPTDLAGQNPRPDLAPHVVNNSWGGGGGDPWYTQVVETWVDLGIFPVFAAGNSGPGCGTAGSPGDYATAYAVGALDAEDQVASFSSRGAGGFGGVKPNIAAPGVGVRSAIPGGYRAFSGTSMAAPHVAGAVALMWSAAPTLVGDVSRTRALLDTTAVDVADTSCGGTAENNNVYGEGRLDAAAAVAAAPQGPTGTLTGAVVSAETDGPVGFATIRVAGEGGRARTAVADAQGLFSLVVPAGLNTVTADAFGYLPREVDVPVAEGEVQHVQIDLASAPRYTVSGTVHDLFGAPVVGARVVLAGVPLPGGVTDETGRYQIPDVPAGEYTLEVPESGCAARTSTVVTVAGDTEADLVVPPRDDGVAYSCRAKQLEWIAGTDLVPLTGIDDVVTIDLPFEFHMYGPQESPIGRRASKAHVATNGFVGFDRPNDLHINRPVPSVGNPSCAIFPFWDDLVVDEQASVQTALVGTAPNRRFAIEWRNVTFWQGTGRVTFEVVLHEDGTIDLQYLELTGGRGWGTSATVAVESCNGAHALQYSHSEPSLTSGQAIRFNPGSEVDGTVLDAAGSPVEFADIRALKAGTSVVAAETSADGDGAFTLPVLPGLYTVEASRLGYQPIRSQLHVAAEGVTQDFVLEGVRNDMSGFVLDDLGLPAVDATVELQHGPGAGEEIATVAVDPDGFFRFEDVPAGDGATSYYYNVRVHAPCLTTNTSHRELIEVTAANEGNLIRDVTLAGRGGRQCRHRQVTEPLTETTPVPLSGAKASTSVSLPFTFPFYGETFSTVWITTEGYLTLGGHAPLVRQSTGCLAGGQPDQPDHAVYAFWEDLTIDEAASVWTATLGAEPDRVMVIGWQNVLIDGTDHRISFEAHLHESGRVRFQYREIPSETLPIAGVVGLEAAGAFAPRFEYLCGTESNFRKHRVVEGRAVEIWGPGHVVGTVVDAATGLPVAGATVRAQRPDRPSFEAVTATDGTFALQVGLGQYAVEVSAAGYLPAAAEVTVAQEQRPGTVDVTLEPDPG